MAEQSAFESGVVSEALQYGIAAEPVGREGFGVVALPMKSGEGHIYVTMSPSELKRADQRVLNEIIRARFGVAYREWLGSA